MKLAQPKIRDTEEGPEPAAPPRAEGVVPLPRSERGGSGTAAQGEIPCQPRRASCSWMRISVAPKSATRFFSWSMTAGGALATKASLPSLALDRKSTRLNSSHSQISYAVFCLKKKKKKKTSLTY